MVIADKECLSRLSNLNLGLPRIEYIDDCELLSLGEQRLQGYLQQQIIKLRFYEICKSPYYFCMDSDAVVHDTIRINDFIDEYGRIKDFVITDSSVELQRDWLKRYYVMREEYLRRIKDFYKINEFVSPHGFVSLSVNVVSEMNKFLTKRGESFRSIIEKAPMEFSWYFGYMKRTQMEINPCRSLFHTFHTATDYKITCNDVSIKKIQQTYKGYILNSNWADDCKIYELGQRLPLTFHLRELFRK